MTTTVRTIFQQSSDGSEPSVDWVYIADPLIGRVIPVCLTWEIVQDARFVLSSKPTTYSLRVVMHQEGGNTDFAQVSGLAPRATREDVYADLCAVRDSGSLMQDILGQLSLGYGEAYASRREAEDALPRHAHDLGAQD